MLRRSSGVPANRHARPSALPARVAVTTALGGLVLPATLSAAVSPAAAAEQQQSVTRISAPSTTAPGAVRVSVRLVSDGAYVKNGVVDVQIPEGSGWRTIAQAPTNAQGLGYATVRVTRDKQVRAHYRGSSVRTPATSDVRTVAVRQTGSSSAVLREASRHSGKPYRYGATGPSSFDCSGFTAYVYAKATGKKLPHNARAQEDVARPVSKSQARPGDLVFIQDVAGHVGIYAGGGKMWDAPRSGKNVSLRSIWTSNYTVGRV